jgi:uncharacterized protein (TIGR00159 family)
VIEHLWGLLRDFVAYLAANYDPVQDTVDILVVALGVYWLLLLIRGTRAVQMLVGLLLLIAASAASQLFELTTLSWILDRFLGSAVLIIIVLFQHDIRRALARVGRGFFPSVSERQESQMLEEVVRAAQTLAQKRVGALVVLVRETSLEDQIEAGTLVDAAVSKELLTALFLPYSPLHDGATVIENGRIHSAGCVLPLSLRTDLPEGLGTRHRAALGITEETDAVVVVVSEETGSISVVAGGEMTRDLDGPRLRSVLRDVLAAPREPVDAPPRAAEEPAEPAASERAAAPRAHAPSDAGRAAS